MTAQLRSELRKVLSTRSVYLVTLAAVAINVISVFSLSGQSAADFAAPLPEQQFFFLGTFVKLLILMIGIRLVTDEYRFGTIVPTMLFAPRRRTVIVAKVLVGAAAGGVAGLLAEAALVGSGFLMFSIEGHTLELGASGGAALAGMALTGVLWGAIGVAIGAVVKSQVAALVGTFVWFMMLDEMIGSRLDVSQYLPGGAGFGLALARTDRLVVLGTLVLGAYALAGTLLGVLVTRRSDIA